METLRVVTMIVEIQFCFRNYHVAFLEESSLMDLFWTTNST